jgi:RNAse (barnase) inhibitor barstar
MAAFHPDEWQKFDYQLLRNSPVTLYHRLEVLDQILLQLKTEGYTIDELDCSTWKSEADFHRDIAKCLEFPDYYGQNLDAFNDCMRDIEVPDLGGRIIVLRKFDVFAFCEPEIAQIVLDILARSSWRFLLTGQRLMTLVQSTDPRIAFDVVGAHPVMWNPQEWLNKNRGL